MSIKSCLRPLIPILTALSWAAATAVAGYPTAKRNELVHEEIAADSDRMIPQSDFFAASVDGQIYERALGAADFYHGVGYWIQVRTEYKPHPYFTANLRSIFYAGSCSFGYAAPSDQYHLLGVTGIWPNQILDGELKMRALDLGRQTMGVGLLVDQKEFNGAEIAWTGPGLSLSIKVDGTGALLIRDDLWMLEARALGGLLGLGIGNWAEGVYGSDPKRYRDAYAYAFSEYREDWFDFAAEAGNRAGIWAAMAKAGASLKTESLKTRAEIQYRAYTDGFGRDFVGGIEHEYISYDQYDKAYTNAMNVFVLDDDVMVVAGQLNLEYAFNDRLTGEFLNEAGQFDYRQMAPHRYYYGRLGIGYEPLPNRDDQLVVFVSNKVLVDSYALPPNTVSQYNSALFYAETFMGAEANFRF